MSEVWKPVVGYEGYYEVSSLGRIRSVKRTVKGIDGKNYRLNSAIKRQFDNGKGYYYVSLCVNGVQKPMVVHRLVAKAFLPNPDNLPEVNHKDENPLNNRADNLEWCTRQYNQRYGTHDERVARAAWKPVVGIDNDGNEFYFASVKEAAKAIGKTICQISSCCNGKRKTSGGLRWRYAEKTS